MSKKNKDALFDQCILILQSKIARYSSKINELDIAIAEDTKSSAGDKFETSREMHQQEIDKLNGQLEIVKSDLLKISHLNNKESSLSITEGSLVQTNIMHFLIAASVGKLSVNNQIFYVISAQAPIAKILFGKFMGDTVTFNGKTHTVLSIM